MSSIRWKLVFMYLTLVFIVMIISGTFIIIRTSSQEIQNAEEELAGCAAYISEQIIDRYENREDFQEAFLQLYITSSTLRNVQANIIDSAGNTIASSTAASSEDFIDYNNSAVISALAGNEAFSSGTKSTDLNSQVKEWISYALPVKDRLGRVEYVVYVQMDASGINSNIMQITSTILVAVLLALLLACVVALVFANTITKPIALLTRKANQLAKNRLNTHINIISNDEIGQLSKSFNHMASELKKTVSEMENENKKLDVLLQNMTDGVLAFDERGTLIHANNLCYEMLDIDRLKISLDWFLEKLEVDYSELLPNTITEIVVEENHKYINVALIPYESDNISISGVIAVLSDITKHRELDDMRKEFVANVSHEIRTPLTTIKSYVETLLDGALEDEQTARDFLKVIDDAADRMSLLASDLLSLSRLDTNNVRFNMKKLDLARIAENCITQNILTAANNKHSLSLIPPAAENYYIYADEGRLMQVVNNIVSNSIKYSGDGADITLKITSGKTKYYLEIKDNGIGIEEGELKRIFERFYRIDKARSRSMGGNGLGLSIAKELTEEMGGSIDAYSSPGEGLTMLLTFPKYKEPKKKKQTPV
ncbi:MAG: cell wall metabolism sensor histidine kinase WalK [Clostridiales bacterium]|nr:cell wall metabolism sensor histidine kinase WalK [Clostridiales bacterium]